MSWNASQFVTLTYKDDPTKDARPDLLIAHPKYEDSYSWRMDKNVDWQYEGDPCQITQHNRYEEYNEGKVDAPILELPMFQREGPAYRLSEQNIQGAISQVYNVFLPKTSIRGEIAIRTDSVEDMFISELVPRLEGQGMARMPNVKWGTSFNNQTHADRLSKALSQVCRHDSSIKRYGGDWVDLRDVMKAKITIFPYTDPELFLAVIMQNEKSRFKLSLPIYQSFYDINGKLLHLPKIFLRCVQGHSVKTPKGQGMLAITPANVHKFSEVYHGCQYKDVRGIRDTGALMAGGPHRVRQAAHFALTTPVNNNDRTCGFRLNAPVLISFDLQKYVMDYPNRNDVFLASNKVISVFNDIETWYLTSCDEKGHDQMWWTFAPKEKLDMLKKSLMGEAWEPRAPEPEGWGPHAPEPDPIPSKPTYGVDLEESDVDEPMPDASGGAASSSGLVSHERLTEFPTGKDYTPVILSSQDYIELRDMQTATFGEKNIFNIDAETAFPFLFGTGLQASAKKDKESPDEAPHVASYHDEVHNIEKPAMVPPASWPTRFHTTSYPVAGDPALHEKNIHAAVLDAGNEELLEMWADYAINHLPTSMTTEETFAKSQAGVNTYSMQLSVLVANMGNLLRKSTIKGTKLKKDLPNSINLLSQFVIRNWAHIRVFIEADGIKSDKHQEIMSDQGLIGMHSPRWSELAVYIIGQASWNSSVTCLYDGGNTKCCYAIFEVDFGLQSNHGEDFENTRAGELAKERALAKGKDAPIYAFPHERCERCTRPKWRVAVIHTNNTASYGAVHQVLTECYDQCFALAVDIVCGDGNQHYYYNSKKHKQQCMETKSPELHKGLPSLMAQYYTHQHNRNKAFHLRTKLYLLDNNQTWRSNFTTDDLDCMFVQIFSRGNTAGAMQKRTEIELKCHDLISKYHGNHIEHLRDEIDFNPTCEWSADNLHTLLDPRYHACLFQQMEEEDMLWIDAHNNRSSFIEAPNDLEVRVSERVKELTHTDLWLSVKDCDWHAPIMFTLRDNAMKNMRKRSEASWNRRAAKQEDQDAKKSRQETSSKTMGAAPSTKGKGKGKKSQGKSSSSSSWHGSSSWQGSSSWNRATWAASSTWVAKGMPEHDDPLKSLASYVAIVIVTMFAMLLFVFLAFMLFQYIRHHGQYPRRLREIEMPITDNEDDDQQNRVSELEDTGEEAASSSGDRRRNVKRSGPPVSRWGELYPGKGKGKPNQGKNTDERTYFSHYYVVDWFDEDFPSTHTNLKHLYASCPIIRHLPREWINTYPTHLCWMQEMCPACHTWRQLCLTNQIDNTFVAFYAYDMIGSDLEWDEDIARSEYYLTHIDLNDTYTHDLNDPYYKGSWWHSKAGFDIPQQNSRCKGKSKGLPKGKGPSLWNLWAPHPGAPAPLPLDPSPVAIDTFPSASGPASPEEADASPSAAAASSSAAAASSCAAAAASESLTQQMIEYRAHDDGVYFITKAGTVKHFNRNCGALLCSRRIWVARRDQVTHLPTCMNCGNRPLIEMRRSGDLNYNA